MSLEVDKEFLKELASTSAKLDQIITRFAEVREEDFRARTEQNIRITKLTEALQKLTVVSTRQFSTAKAYSDKVDYLDKKINSLISNEITAVQLNIANHKKNWSIIGAFIFPIGSIVISVITALVLKYLIN